MLELQELQGERLQGEWLQGERLQGLVEGLGLLLQGLRSHSHPCSALLSGWDTRGGHMEHS